MHVCVSGGWWGGEGGGGGGGGEGGGWSSRHYVNQEGIQTDISHTDMSDMRVCIVHLYYVWQRSANRIDTLATISCRPNINILQFRVTRKILYKKYILLIMHLVNISIIKVQRKARSSAMREQFTARRHTLQSVFGSSSYIKTHF